MILRYELRNVGFSRRRAGQRTTLTIKGARGKKGAGARRSNLEARMRERPAVPSCLGEQERTSRVKASDWTPTRDLRDVASGTQRRSVVPQWVE